MPAVAQIGPVAGTAAYGLLIVLFMMVRPPIPRRTVAFVFAAPAAIAGYALVHGIMRHAVPSDIWRMIFCLVGGGLTGLPALMRIASQPNDRHDSAALQRD